LAIADRDSARGLFKENQWPQIVLSLAIVSGFVTLVAVMFSGVLAIDDSMRDVANILIGVLASSVTMVLKFWFGGSPNDGAHIDKIYNSTPHNQ
jgi:hypothetical protein